MLFDFKYFWKDQKISLFLRQSRFTSYSKSLFFSNIKIFIQIFQLINQFVKYWWQSSSFKKRWGIADAT